MERIKGPNLPTQGHRLASLTKMFKAFLRQCQPWWNRDVPVILSLAALLTHRVRRKQSAGVIWSTTGDKLAPASFPSFANIHPMCSGQRCTFASFGLEVTIRLNFGQWGRGAFQKLRCVQHSFSLRTLLQELNMEAPYNHDYKNRVHPWIYNDMDKMPNFEFFMTKIRLLMT